MRHEHVRLHDCYTIMLAHGTGEGGRQMDVRRPPDGVTITAQPGERERFSGTWRAGVFPTEWYFVAWISLEPALQLEQICSIRFEFFVYLLF